MKFKRFTSFTWFRNNDLSVYTSFTYCLQHRQVIDLERFKGLHVVDFGLASSQIKILSHAKDAKSATGSPNQNGFNRKDPPSLSLPPSPGFGATGWRDKSQRTQKKLSTNYANEREFEFCTLSRPRPA